MKPKLILHEYYIADTPREATISFVNHEFKECKFKTSSTIYNLADWKFLGELSQQIQELTIQEYKW